MNKKFEDAFAKMLFGAGERIDLYDSIADFLASMNLSKAVEKYRHQLIMQKVSKSDAKFIVVNDIYRKLEKGATLAAAMQQWIPPLEFTILRSMEDAGKLADGLSTVVKFIEESGNLRAEWVGAVAYPAFLMLGILGLFYIYGTQVFPQISGMVPVEKWEASGQHLYAIAHFVAEYWYLLVLFAVVFAVLVVISLPYYTGSLRKYLDKLPPWSFYKMDMAMAFVASLISLMKTDKNQLDVVQDLANQGTPYSKIMLRPVVRALNSGKPLGEALNMTGNEFPDVKLIMLIMLHDGSSTLVTKFPAQYKRWTEGKAKTVKKMSKVIGLLGMVATAGVMMTVTLIMSGITSTIGTVMQQLN